MLRNAFPVSVITALICLPVLAQSYSYNYSYGSSRVVQGGNGLATPSSSYIGPGTISKSAQGYNTTAPVPNPGLPAVNLGANIHTPGDNQYRPKPQTNQLPAGRLGANIGMPGDNMRSDMHYYTPGQNLRAVQQYQNGQPQPQYFYQPGGGTATYGATGYGDSSGDDGARHF